MKDMEKEKRVQELKYEFICEFIKLRKENNFTQQKMADKTGVLREKIARIERVMHSPKLDSLIEILEPLGYTVKIERIKK